MSKLRKKVTASFVIFQKEAIAELKDSKAENKSISLAGDGKFDSPGSGIVLGGEAPYFKPLIVL